MTYIPPQNNQKTAFGELITAEITPIVQIANQYALDPTLRNELETFSATGGVTDSVDNLFRCQTGTSVGGYGVIRSKNAVTYRPGLGINSRITAAFTTGVASSLQFAGLFSLTDTLAFGYDGADFGIIHQYDGQAEVQEIEVTGAAGGAESATVTLDGDAVSCSLTASTVQQNAFEIERDCKADATLSAKWRFEQEDDKVICIAKSTGDKTGTMSFSSSTATATVTEKNAGADKSQANVAQASWNITTTPFTGFDPTKLNIYRVQVGYLGALGAIYSIFDPNTGEFVDVHRMEWANANTTPFVGSPDMKVGWTAASLGSTTDLTVTGASMLVAVEGKEVVKNTAFAADNSTLSVGTTGTNIITLKNRIVYGDRFNLGKLQPQQISVENDHNKAAVVEVYLNTTLGGSTNYQVVDDVNSIAIIDTAGTTVTGGTLVESFTVAPGGAIEINLSGLNIEVLPEETLTISARTVSGTSTEITGTVTWLEEK